MPVDVSEFFRNPLTFALLEQLILPALVGKSGRGRGTEIRVWSAACAAGQEAYSIAILLDEMAANRGDALSFRIFATDRSPEGIVAAQKGIYDYAAVQNVRWKYLRNYFIREGDVYTIIPALRNRIDFSVYDVLDEQSSSPPPSIYGDFDLVICSNLLFYYRPDMRRRILNKAWAALSPGGYLVTGEAERDIVARHDGFRAVVRLSAVFQKIARRE